MTDAIPIWAIVVDYLMGTVMWTLIGRFGMRGHSEFAAATSPALSPVRWPIAAVASTGVIVSLPSTENASRG